MKRTTCFLTLFLWTCVVHLLAAGDAKEDVLKRLDKVIKEKTVFQLRKEQQIDELKTRLARSSDNQERYELYNALFASYLHYQADSAYCYANRKKQLLPLSDNPVAEGEIIINRAEVLAVMGMYNEALEHLEQLDSRSLDKKTRAYYYQTCRAYYGWLADYTSGKPEKQKYLDKTAAYRDSILLATNRGIDWYIVYAEKKITCNETDSALVILSNLLKENLDNRQKCYVHYTFAEAYKATGDVQNEIKHLTHAAVSDLESSIREYASLQELAFLMYQTGDYDRAYEYLNCSMEDAVSCNARLRFIEVTEFFPIIDKAYKQKEKEKSRIFHVLLISVSIMSFFQLAAIFC